MRAHTLAIMSRSCAYNPLHHRVSPFQTDENDVIVQVLVASSLPQECWATQKKVGTTNLVKNSCPSHPRRGGVNSRTLRRTRLKFWGSTKSAGITSPAKNHNPLRPIKNGLS